MNSKLYNLSAPVLNAVAALGYSSVAIVAALNAQRGECVLVEETARAGKPSGKRAKKDKPSVYRISESRTLKYEGDLNIAQDFDVFNRRVQDAYDWEAFENIEIPRRYVEWFASCKGFKPTPEASVPPVNGKAKNEPVPAAAPSA